MFQNCMFRYHMLKVSKFCSPYIFGNIVYLTLHGLCCKVKMASALLLLLDVLIDISLSYVLKSENLYGPKTLFGG